MAVRPGRFVNPTNPEPGRVADTLRFYALPSRISERTGGYRCLATCDGRIRCRRCGRETLPHVLLSTQTTLPTTCTSSASAV